MNKVELIKDRLTMNDVLSRYGYPTKRRMPCMLHGGKDNNFEVKEKSWRCYSHCGSGDVIAFVQKLFDLSFPDALKKIDTDFNFGLYERISNRKSLDIARQAYNRSKEKERQKQQIEAVKNRYWDMVSEYAKLDKNKREFAPKTPDEEWHPLFVEALQKLAHQEYLLDCAESEVYEIEHRNNAKIYG